MVSIQKEKVKKIIFAFIMIFIIYFMHLFIQEFLDMVTSVNYEEAISDFVRLFTGELYWYEKYLMDLMIVFIFYIALFNSIAVIYSVRPPFKSLKSLYRYKHIL
jgi:hypothetical protein